MSQAYYEDLGNAIICQAADDYRSAMNKSRKYSDIAFKLQEVIFTEEFKNLPLADNKKIETIKRYLSALSKTRSAVSTMMECRNFFRSKWYSQLTEVNPDCILNTIESEFIEKEGGSNS